MSRAAVAPPRSAGRSGVSLEWHVWIAAAAIALLLVVPTRADPDLWGHVRFGLDWLHSHRLPILDPYSFTQDRPWINHEWLSEAFMAAAFAAWGNLGLVILKTTVVLATLAIIVRRLRGAAPAVAAIVVLLSAASALPIIGTVRPQIASLLGLALVVAVADSAQSFIRRVVVLALVFAVWANLHGGWITGLGALGAYAFVRWGRSRATLPRAAAIIAIPLAATLLNPYGAGLWRFLASTVRAARPDITEWQPFTLHDPAIMWVAVLFPIVLLAIASARKSARPAPEIMAAVLVLIVAGLRVSRVAPLIGPAVAVALGPSIVKRFERIGEVRAASAGGALVLVAPVLAIVGAVLPWIVTSAQCVPVRDTWAPDRAAASSLEGARGRLWVAFDWGEYALWHFGPALRVSIDGRRETVYSDAIIRLHRGFDLGEPAARAEFVRLSPEYVWLRIGDGSVERWLTDHRYRILSETGTSFVAARSDVTPPGRPSAGLSGCFP